ncbi:MAG: nitrate/nitrite transporter NrtS [Crocosphaera sp.]
MVVFTLHRQVFYLSSWLSGLLTYLVPYGVSIYGQYISRSRN